MMVLAGLSHGLKATTLRRLATIVEALFVNGRPSHDARDVAMERAGGSYQTIQRFFNSRTAWDKIHCLIIREH